MKIYLAGKITGDPCYKAKFEYAANELQERTGHIVLNPAILPERGFDHDAYMRMTAAMLEECDAVCLLPDWKQSEGAMTEYGRAAARGMRIIEYADAISGAMRS